MMMGLLMVDVWWQWQNSSEEWLVYELISDGGG